MKARRNNQRKKSAGPSSVQRRVRGTLAISAGQIAGKTTAEELLRLAVEAFPAAMMMSDQSGRIILVNSQAETLFGYGRDELIGKTMESLIPECFRDKHTGRRSESCGRLMFHAAGRTVFASRKDGTALTVEIAFNPIATAASRFVLVAIVDITQRLTMEKKLAHSETLAEIGSMISVVAHEIRNPLGTIVMAARAVAQNDLSREEHDQVLSLLTLETDRLNRTLKGILQFAKPCEPNLERGDLNAMTHDVLAAVKLGPHNAGRTRIREVLDDRLPQIHFDVDQMRQVLWNIVCNAFQAVNGEGLVEVTTEARHGAVVIHIRDDGPGIPPDQLEKIFLPFFTTKSQGTGLGLPTSRNIIRAHGGDIRVESEPGRGSRFSIFIPAPGESGN